MRRRERDSMMASKDLMYSLPAMLSRREPTKQKAFIGEKEKLRDL